MSEVQNKRINKARIEKLLLATYELDYQERPVSIDEFIEKREYLGSSTNFGRGIYPIWREVLREIFDYNDRYLIVFTGAIGTGKSSIAVIGLLYVMYRVLCLKNPWQYFSKTESGKMAISFFNLTKNLSESRGFQIMQGYLRKSAWFRRRGFLASNEVRFDLFEYLLASPYSRGFGVIGHNIIGGLMDEVDSPTESEKQKFKVLKAYEATARRFESRFVVKGRSLGKLFLCASKQDEMSFLETYIASMRGAKNVLVYDIPLWKAQPKSVFSGKTFLVACGDAYTSPKILKDEDERKKAEEQGFKVIEVPEEYRTSFETDIIGSLRDIAGINVSYIRKTKLFSSEKFLNLCYDPQTESPITKPEIILDLESEDELIWYLDVGKLVLPKEVPRYIHLDVGISHDALGIAMSGIERWEEINVQKPDGTFVKQKAPIVRTDFVMRIVAKEGKELPLFKIRKFVLDLKALGFNIKLFTSDLKLASTDTLQILQVAGINSEYFSVDRTTKPYMDFKQLVLEKRWVMYKDSYLHFELSNLEWDKEQGKIDHPDKVQEVVFLEDGNVKEVVLKGSKDLADAVCGSVAKAVEVESEEIKKVMDVDKMKAILEKVKSGEETSDFLKKVWWAEIGGKEIVGTAEDIKKFIGLLKRKK